MIIGFIVVIVAACDAGSAETGAGAADPVGRRFINPMTTPTLFPEEGNVQFLQATVHICLESWLVDEGERGYTILHSDGYGTVVDARYLITHNHHGIPIGWAGDEMATDVFSRLIVYDYQERLVDTLSLQSLRVARADPYTLVLVYVGESPMPFGTSGLRPEQVACDNEVRPMPEDEVFQVNLRQGQLFMEQTTILAVEMHHEQGCLKLASPPETGASGGGVFYHGRHIANHWLRGQVTDCAGNPIACYGKAAVNSCELPLLFTAP